MEATTHPVITSTLKQRAALLVTPVLPLLGSATMMTSLVPDGTTRASASDTSAHRTFLTLASLGWILPCSCVFTLLASELKSHTVVSDPEPKSHSSKENSEGEFLASSRGKVNP